MNLVDRQGLQGTGNYSWFCWWAMVHRVDAAIISAIGAGSVAAATAATAVAATIDTDAAGRSTLSEDGNNQKYK
jgi:hypothetical protein